MPKQRLQIPSDIAAPGLQTAARPRDSFVQPTGAGSQAAQLADALSGLAPDLARFGTALYERNADKDKIAGAEKAREVVRDLDENRRTYADAVREGTIPAHLNPWMKQGYYEELGRLYAGRYQADLTAAIQSDENLKNTVEMGDFRAFAAKFEEEWREASLPAEARNQAFLTGFGARRDAILANLEAGWSAQTEQRFTKRTLAMFRDESVGFIHEALDAEQSVEQIGAFLRQTWDDKHALGWDGRLTGTTLVDAIADVALARKDPELMEKLLASIPGGPAGSPTGTLARTSYATAAIEENADNIARARNREWQATERAQRETATSIVQEALERLENAEQEGSDPDLIEIDDLQMLALQNGSVEVVTHLQTLKDSYRNREYDDDSDVVAGFLEKLHKGPYVLRQVDLDMALRSKSLSLTTYNSLSTQRENGVEAAKRAAAGAGGPGSGFLGDDDEYKYAEREVLRYLGGSQDGAAAQPVVNHARTQALRQLSAWYHRTFVSADAPHRGATGQQKREMIDRQAEALGKTWMLWDEYFTVPDEGQIMRLSAQSLDWHSNRIVVPDRNELLIELGEILARRSTRPPSPQLVSLIRIYGLDPSNFRELGEFVTAQMQFFTPE